MVLKRKCNQHYNLSTLQPYNNLILSQNDFSEHGIPERRSITHGSEAKGKKKMQLYAHNRIYKSIAIIFNVQKLG